MPASRRRYNRKNRPNRYAWSCRAFPPLALWLRPARAPKMRQRKNELIAEHGLELLERHWKWLVVAFWLLFCAWFIVNRSNEIRFFSLGDTDDNMRMMQVRGLLHGQGWFDLQQHRLAGSNIHWSRLVDLPIAGLILAPRPSAGRWASRPSSHISCCCSRSRSQSVG